MNLIYLPSKTMPHFGSYLLVDFQNYTRSLSSEKPFTLFMQAYYYLYPDPEYVKHIAQRTFETIANIPSGLNCVQAEEYMRTNYPEIFL